MYIIEFLLSGLRLILIDNWPITLTVALGLAAISATALAASRSCLSPSGSFLNVVPARLSTFSQPARSTQPASFAGSAPCFL